MADDGAFAAVKPHLNQHEIRQINQLAETAAAHPDDMVGAIVSAYLRLAKDAPAALPRDDFKSLSLKRKKS